MDETANSSENILANLITQSMHGWAKTIGRQVCLLMTIAYIGFNALLDEQWKCDMILELTDCIYGFSKCGLS